MSMFNDIMWRIKDNEQECIANATFVCICKKIFSRTLVILRTWIRKEVVFYLCNERPQGEWDRVQLMMIRDCSNHLRFTETLIELTVSKSLLLRLNETPENFTGRIILMSMFNDIS